MASSSLLILHNDLLLCIIDAQSEAEGSAGKPGNKILTRALLHFASTCKRIRSLAASKVFHALAFRGGDHSLRAGLKVVATSPLLLSNTRLISVDCTRMKRAALARCGTSADAALIRLLRAKPDLETLRLIVPPVPGIQHARILRQNPSTPLLPNLKTLACDQLSVQLTRHCPQLDALHVMASEKLEHEGVLGLHATVDHVVQAAVLCPSIKCLSLSLFSVNAKELANIATHLPQLEELQIDNAYYWTTLRNLTKAVATFPRLNTLILSEPCVTASRGYYDSLTDWELRNVGIETARADKNLQGFRSLRCCEFVAERLFKVCSPLKELWFNHSADYNIITSTRGNAGELLDMKWSEFDTEFKEKVEELHGDCLDDDEWEAAFVPINGQWVGADEQSEGEKWAISWDPETA